MAKKCCSTDCVSTVLTIYNIILLITGVAVIGISSWIVYNSHFYVPLLPSASFPTLLYALFTSGLLVAIVAVPFGFLSVAKHNQIFILCYVFVLLFVFLLQGMVGVMSYVFQESMEDQLKLNLNETLMVKYSIDDRITSATDQVQETFKCCGSEVVADWLESVWYHTSDRTRKIPDSCCKTISEGCARVSNRPSNINISGCLEKIAQNSSECLWFMSATGIGLFAFNIIGVLLGMCLYLKLKNDDYPVEPPLLSDQNTLQRPGNKK
ncbi:CD151 antigen-like [Aethina tumida]|uniref:CD151 antigen-like n=1 Tax=Aethina tumida TaxID=116153 RepID=UPI00214914F7|nr:CD151 antigen-like [Aethina tumida]